ncbi:unnamed protein product [Arctia plantaginis]|uniref:Uncharacterized protein n=1 Tax=Arctia plantaginis TaxID=874455 RepID=A0A8S0ZLP7_ARCPL|nr:unnamed protein product [Arctia plantaginis]
MKVEDTLQLNARFATLFLLKPKSPSQSIASVALVREAQINAGHSPADATQLFLNLITMPAATAPKRTC